MDVKIVSREGLMELAKKPFPEGTAVISITDSDAEDVALVHQPGHIIRLKFDDVSDEIFQELLGRKPSAWEMRQIAGRFRMLTNDQARQMAEFVLGLEGADILICQCEYGQSRSAGVAAAVMEYYDRKGIEVFSDVRYYPNKYVFRKLLLMLRTSTQSCS